MKLIQLFQLFSFLLLCITLQPSLTTSNDTFLNESFVITTGNDYLLNNNESFVLGWCPHGMANRLRNLAGVLAVSFCKGINETVFAWQVVPNTPNHFTDLFESIEHLRFIHEDEIPVYRPLAKVVISDHDNGIREVLGQEQCGYPEPLVQQNLTVQVTT